MSQKVTPQAKLYHFERNIKVRLSQDIGVSRRETQICLCQLQSKTWQRAWQSKDGRTQKEWRKEDLTKRA